MRPTPALPPLLLSLALAACGGKVSTDVTLPQDTGEETDGGATDGGATDGGVPTETDDDGDGWSVEDGDCDDANPNINPGASDVCYDGVDANCDGANEYDCDRDGYDSSSHGGEDCNDTDAAIYPGALENRPDGKDNDCDGATDEDGYCNVYAPMANATSAYRTYASTGLWDGATYIETTQLESYNETARTVKLARTYDNGSGSTVSIKESWACASDGTASVSGYSLSAFSIYNLNITFSSASVRALPQEQMIPGATWSFDYIATDATEGQVWTMMGTATVQEPENISTIAGIFATLPVRVDYEIVSSYDMVASEKGTFTWYLAPGVGLVYSLQTYSDGSVGEERELSSYGGFYAMDPADFM